MSHPRFPLPGDPLRLGPEPRPALKHPEGCEGCHYLPGVLVGVNGQEVQRCDECSPAWDDEDAVKALREAFPWIVVTFDPDRDEETGAVADPSIGVYVLDYEQSQIPPDAPAWLVHDLWTARDEGTRGHLPLPLIAKQWRQRAFHHMREAATAIRENDVEGVWVHLGQAEAEISILDDVNYAGADAARARLDAVWEIAVERLPDTA